MNATPSRHTPDSWSAASQSYAERVAPSLMESFAEELVDRLEVDESSEVLEVGAGSGALTETLAKKVNSVLATDFAPGMIDVLRARMAEAGLTNVRCEVMDGQALEIEDASFDGVGSSFALMLFPDRARGFSELKRVLSPRGRAVVSGWTGPDKFEAFGLFLEAIESAFPDMPPPPQPPAVFSLADPASFKAEMEAAGFGEVEVDLVARDLDLQ